MLEFSGNGTGVSFSLIGGYCSTARAAFQAPIAQAAAGTGRLKPQRRRLEVERLTASLREDALFLDLAALLREEARDLLRDAEEREREATERDLA